MTDKDARAVIMVPQRDLVTKKLIAKFLLSMASCGLVLLEEQTLVGQDDWDEDGEDSGIECWLAVFGRQ